MQIRSDCNALNIAGYQCISFISLTQFLRIKSCGMDTPDPTWESFEILLLHVLSNDAWQFTINLFPSAEGHLKMLIYHFFLFKMQIWNDCNALNIAGYPIKDINVNLSFLSLGSKLWNDPPDPTWKFLKFYFCMYCPMMHDNLP